MLTCSGCYTNASVLGRDDGGLDAPPPGSDAGPPANDAFAFAVDAAYVDAGCSTGAPCGSGRYCDFGGGCGAPGMTGACVEVGYCAPPGGLVCGCDGRDYIAPCEAHAAGTNVTVGHGCPSASVSDRVAAAIPACSPTGGPAWTFTIAGTDSVCDDDRPGIQITLYADLSIVPDGTAFEIGAGVGVAQSCPHGLHAACIALGGTVVVESFDEGTHASITFGLVGHAGTRDAPIDVRALEHAVEITTWCTGTPTCS